MHIEEILKKIHKLEEHVKNLDTLGKDAVLFVGDKNLWEEFIKFHAEKEKERNASS